MGLGALPPNTTARYKLFYTYGAHQHTMEARTLMSPSAFGQFCADLWTALGVGVFTTDFDTFQFAAAGSNVFNDVITGHEGDHFVGGGTSVAAQEAAYFYDFVGRSPDGRKVRMFTYGAVSQGLDFNIAAGESSLIDAALVVINAASPKLTTISGVTAVWKTYARAGVSAYWQKRVRP